MIGLREADEIAAVAARNNSTLGVTGILLFDGTYFMQTVEGPLAQVLLLFRKISDDPRHSNIIPFCITRPASRRFPDWSMRLIPPEATRVLIPDLETFDFTVTRLAQVHAGILSHKANA